MVIWHISCLWVCLPTFWKSMFSVCCLPPNKLVHDDRVRNTKGPCCMILVQRWDDEVVVTGIGHNLLSMCLMIFLPENREFVMNATNMFGIIQIIEFWTSQLWSDCWRQDEQVYCSQKCLIPITYQNIMLPVSRCLGNYDIFRE